MIELRKRLSCLQAYKEIEMVSLKDIAAACGVSIATVSKALNNQSDISSARRDEIRKKAEEMGYHPNLMARALKTKVTHDIGVLFSDDFRSGLTHPFFSQVLEGLKLGLEEKGYDLTFIDRGLGEKKPDYVNHCRYRNLDGVVIACVDFSQPSVIDLVQSDIPLVTIDHVFDQCATISSNNSEGMRTLTEYIVGQGHRRIAYIHGKPSSVTNARLASFFRVMEENGIRVPDEYVREASYLDVEEVEKAARELMSLKERPTCILFPDDYSCIGGLNAARAAGLRVPEDISIAGYDGVPIVRIISPKITTYEQSMQEIGLAAAAKIIELIERPRTALRDNTVIKGKLFPGETVRKIQ